MTTEQKTTGIYSLGIVAVLSIAVLVLAVFGQSTPAPKDWSHRELLDHLKRKGLKVTSAAAKSASAHGPAMYFFLTPDTDAANMATYYDAGGPLDASVIHVLKMKSVESAKDQAGTLGKSGFSWGRFLFQGHSASLDTIRKRL